MDCNTTHHPKRLKFYECPVTTFSSFSLHLVIKSGIHSITITAYSSSILRFLIQLLDCRIFFLFLHPSFFLSSSFLVRVLYFRRYLSDHEEWPRALEKRSRVVVSSKYVQCILYHIDLSADCYIGTMGNRTIVVLGLGNDWRPGYRQMLGNPLFDIAKDVGRPCKKNHHRYILDVLRNFCPFQWVWHLNVQRNKPLTRKQSFAGECSVTWH